MEFCDTRLQFASKFKTFPVVNTTCDWLTEHYTKLKEANFITKCTCDLAETTFKSSLHLATPLVNKFKDQVNYLDAVACNQLDKIETNFPLIKSDTDVLVRESKLFLNKTIEPAYLCFSILNKTKCAVTQRGLNFDEPIELAHKLLDIGQHLMDSYLIFPHLKYGSVTTNIQYYLDHKEAAKSHKEMLTRIRILSYVLLNSLKAQIVEYINTTAHVIHENIYQVFRLLARFKSRLILKMNEKFYLTKEKLDLYKEYLDVLSKQFTVQDGRSLHHVYVRKFFFLILKNSQNFKFFLFQVSGRA